MIFCKHWLAMQFTVKNYKYKCKYKYVHTYFLIKNYAHIISTYTHLLHMLLATNFYIITNTKMVPYGMFENQNEMPTKLICLIYVKVRISFIAKCHHRLKFLFKRQSRPPSPVTSHHHSRVN